MEARDPERDAEQRALGILEHGLSVTQHDLHVTHDHSVDATHPVDGQPPTVHPDLQITHEPAAPVVREDSGRTALSEWRPLAEAAEKAHQAEAGGGRRRRPREYNQRRRFRYLWSIPIVLIWAAAAFAVYLMLDSGQV